MQIKRKSFILITRREVSRDKYEVLEQRFDNPNSYLVPLKLHDFSFEKALIVLQDVNQWEDCSERERMGCGKKTPWKVEQIKIEKDFLTRN